jgi:hypothetical protein
LVGLMVLWWVVLKVESTVVLLVVQRDILMVEWLVSMSVVSSAWM